MPCKSGKTHSVCYDKKGKPDLHSSQKSINTFK